jgi:D-glycero-alpha-D-manno-heptose 1-phosphate guanylyltransferase
MTRTQHVHERPGGTSAVILAGGMGTRLRPVVADRPKVVALVNGRPFVTYLLDWLGSMGVTDVVLCTGFLGDHVRAALGESYRGLTVRYSHEPEPLGTGGALRLALPLLSASTVAVLNGDSVCLANLRHVAAWHRYQTMAHASLVLSQVADTARFGRVELDRSGRVREFVEKAAAAGRGWINAGIYLIDRPLLEGLPVGTNLSLEREVFPGWTDGRLFGYRARTQQQFLDIGTPSSYAAASALLAA